MISAVTAKLPNRGVVGRWSPENSAKCAYYMHVYCKVATLCDLAATHADIDGIRCSSNARYKISGIKRMPNNLREAVCLTCEDRNRYDFICSPCATTIGHQTKSNRSCCPALVHACAFVDDC